MSRLDHFYHGTTANLNVGDIVAPRETTGVASNFETTEDKTGWNPGNVAYAEGSADKAALFAKHVAERNKSVGRVYKVEPVNPEDVSQDIYGIGIENTAVQSPSGFKVIDIHEDGIGSEWAE